MSHLNNNGSPGYQGSSSFNPFINPTLMGQQSLMGPVSDQPLLDDGGSADDYTNMHEATAYDGQSDLTSTWNSSSRANDFQPMLQQPAPLPPHSSVQLPIGDQSQGFGMNTTYPNQFHEYNNAPGSQQLLAQSQGSFQGPMMLQNQGTHQHRAMTLGQGGPSDFHAAPHDQNRQFMGPPWNPHESGLPLEQQPLHSFVPEDEPPPYHNFSGVDYVPMNNAVGLHGSPAYLPINQPYPQNLTVHNNLWGPGAQQQPAGNPVTRTAQRLSKGIRNRLRGDNRPY